MKVLLLGVGNAHKPVSQPVPGTGTVSKKTGS